MKKVLKMVLEGWVNNVSPSHVGLLVGNMFSVAVGKKGLPESWKFIPARDSFASASASYSKGASEDGVGNRKEKEKLKKSSGSEVGVEVLTNSMGRWVDEDENEIEGAQNFVITAIKAEDGMLSLEGSFKDEDLLVIVEDVDSAGIEKSNERETTRIHGKDDGDDDEEEEDDDDEDEKEERKRRKREKKEKKEKKKRRKIDAEVEESR